MSESENCDVEAMARPSISINPTTAMAAYLAVQGMACPKCGVRVRNSLLSLNGVLAANIFLEQGIAAAAYDPTRVSSEDLITAVAAAGKKSRHCYEAVLLNRMPFNRALLLTRAKTPA